MYAFKDQTLDIADNGHVEHLTYAGLLSFHQVGAIWGATVGYRAMQVAALALSTERLWDRTLLSVTSAHPGPGVRDAIEYVTRCVSQNRFHLLDPIQPAKCNASMEYRWWISHSTQNIEIELRHGFVPSQFFDLVERMGTAREHWDDEIQLESLKTTLTKKIWQEPLQKLFCTTSNAVPLPQEIDQCTN